MAKYSGFISLDSTAHSCIAITAKLSNNVEFYDFLLHKTELFVVVVVFVSGHHVMKNNTDFL